MAGNLPHIITLPLQNQHDNSTQWRERQIAGGGLVVEPDAQARIEGVDPVTSLVSVSGSYATAAPDWRIPARQRRSPLALWLRVL